jgi:hypothetical protein
MASLWFSAREHNQKPTAAAMLAFLVLMVAATAALQTGMLLLMLQNG